MNPEKQLLKIQDVESIVQMSRGTISRLEKLGQFPRRLKMGACARWRLDDITEWIRTR